MIKFIKSLFGFDQPVKQAEAPYKVEAPAAAPAVEVKTEAPAKKAPAKKAPAKAKAPAKPKAPAKAKAPAKKAPAKKATTAKPKATVKKTTK